jgi:hypothetical protein
MPDWIPTADIEVSTARRRGSAGGSTRLSVNDELRCLWMVNMAPST